MGHAAEPTIIYVGLGRLPQPAVAAMDAVVVELEVEAHSRRIVAANTNLQFPGLKRLLQEVLVGQPVDAAAGHALLELEVRYSAPFAPALLELEVRYSAPFAPALRAATQAAARRAMNGATSNGSALDGATGENGRAPQPAIPSSP